MITVTVAPSHLQWRWGPMDHRMAIADGDSMPSLEVDVSNMSAEEAQSYEELYWKSLWNATKDMCAAQGE